jgi:hypothetical protein
MARRRTLDLTDRGLLGGAGDIMIGAYARQQRRRRLLIAVVGLILISGAVGIYALLDLPDDTAAANERVIAVRCVKCGHTGTVPVEVGNVAFPRKCPACGAVACQKLWECRDCGTQFLNIGGNGVIRCPDCGSGNVGSAVEVRTPPAEVPQATDQNGR